MANVVYASKAKKFRKSYPLPLKLRHGLETLSALTDHQYRNLLMEYADELIYRTHRGTQNLKGKALLKTGEMIEKKYFQPIYPKYRIIDALSFIYPGTSIKFWSYKDSDHTFEWLPIAASMQKSREPTKHLEYKYEWNTAKKGPVEAELTKVDGPYSLAPWLVYSYREEFSKCELCGRVFSHHSFRPEGAYPRNKDQFNYWYDDTTNIYRPERFRGTVCKGPCADLVSALDSSSIKLKHVTHTFLPLPIFLGVIDHANYNPYIRRLAEDFVRYARPLFESGSNSAGREGDCEIVGQYLEVSSD